LLNYFSRYLIIGSTAAIVKSFFWRGGTTGTPNCGHASSPHEVQICRKPGGSIEDPVIIYGFSACPLDFPDMQDLQTVTGSLPPGSVN
jgi:hypothetical protein